MAKVKGVATLKNEGYKDLHCLFCGYFMKVKIYPFNQVEKIIKCGRCKAKHKIEYTESDNGFGINISVSTASEIKSEPELMIF